MEVSQPLLTPTKKSRVHSAKTSATNNQRRRGRAGLTIQNATNYNKLAINNDAVNNFNFSPGPMNHKGNFAGEQYQTMSQYTTGFKTPASIRINNRQVKVASKLQSAVPGTLSPEMQYSRVRKGKISIKTRNQEAKMNRTTMLQSMGQNGEESTHLQSNDTASTQLAIRASRAQSQSRIMAGAAETPNSYINFRLSQNFSQGGDTRLFSQMNNLNTHSPTSFDTKNHGQYTTGKAKRRRPSSSGIHLQNRYPNTTKNLNRKVSAPGSNQRGISRVSRAAILNQNASDLNSHLGFIRQPLQLHLNLQPSSQQLLFEGHLSNTLNMATLLKAEITSDLDLVQKTPIGNRITKLIQSTSSKDMLEYEQNETFEQTTNSGVQIGPINIQTIMSSITDATKEKKKLQLKSTFTEFQVDQRKKDRLAKEAKAAKEAKEAARLRDETTADNTVSEQETDRNQQPQEEKPTDDALGQFFSHGHLQHDTKLDFCVYERTNQKRRIAEQKALEKKWAAESFALKMVKAKELAQAFSLSDELVDRFELPPQQARWGVARAEMRDELAAENGEIHESEYVEDSNGNRLRKQKIIDWKKSLLKKNWEQNKSSKFNCKGDPRAMKDDQITYCVNLLRYCEADFQHNSFKLEQMFYKALGTLEMLYEECGLFQLFDTIACNICEISKSQVMKMLMRSRLMLEIRKDLINIFQKMKKREKILKELNYLIVMGDQKAPFNKIYNDDENSDYDQNAACQLSRKERIKSIQAKVSQLKISSQECVAKIKEVLEHRKIFGSFFIYDGMDYPQLVKLQDKQIDNLLTKFQIEPPTAVRPNAVDSGVEGDIDHHIIDRKASTKSIFEEDYQ